ncbi:hypothetical protein K440DRAFT_643370 [Wilcoxina mikolae CBS 423.85]|nr:hypothetical protein K440DRAFT_643370 [Wilcoxina mikolae CBS 423.85]
MFPRPNLGRKTNISEAPPGKRGDSRYALTDAEVTDMFECHEMAMELEGEVTPKDQNKHPELVGIYPDPHEARNKREVEERKKARFERTTPPFKPRPASRKVATINDLGPTKERSLPGSILDVREVFFNESTDNTMVGDKTKSNDKIIVISDNENDNDNDKSDGEDDEDTKNPPKRKSYWTGKRPGTMTKEEIEYQLNLSPSPDTPPPKTPERTASDDEWDNFPVTPIKEIWPGHNIKTPDLSPGWIPPCAQVQRERKPIEDIHEGVDMPEFVIPSDQEGKDRMLLELVRENHSLKYQVHNLMHRSACRDEQIDQLWAAVNLNAEVIEAVRGGERARRNLAVLMDNGRAPPSRQPVGELSKRGLEREGAGPSKGRKKVRKD